MFNVWPMRHLLTWSLVYDLYCRLIKKLQKVQPHLQLRGTWFDLMDSDHLQVPNSLELIALHKCTSLVAMRESAVLLLSVTYVTPAAKMNVFSET